MPDQNLNYPGSSGYGILSDGRYGRLTGAVTPSTDVSLQYEMWDPTTGKYISNITGLPITGRSSRTGVQYSSGMPSAQSAASAQTVNAPGIGPINPNDPNQRYKPVDIVKSPDVASAEASLMDQFKKTAADSLKGFSDYLNDFKKNMATAQAATSKALDTSGTENALRTAQQGYSGDLNAANQDYLNALTTGAANQRGVVAQANADLPQYDKAVSDVEAQQLAQMQRQFGKYKLASGTPSTPSSYDAAILAREAGAIAAPMELEKVNRRYDILNRMALPTEQNITGANINYAGNFLPGIASSRYGSATGTAQAIQNLRNQVAGMSTDQAIRFLQASGIPAQIAQQILGTDITQLGALGQVEDQSRYRGLSDVLGFNLTQPQYFSTAQPGFPQYPSRYPQSRVPGQPANAPTIVTPTTGTGTTAQPQPPNLNLGGQFDTVQPGMNYAGPSNNAGNGGALIIGSDGVPTYGGTWSGRNQQQASMTPEQYDAYLSSIGAY